MAPLRQFHLPLASAASQCTVGGNLLREMYRQYVVDLTSPPFPFSQSSTPTRYGMVADDSSDSLDAVAMRMMSTRRV